MASRGSVACSPNPWTTPGYRRFWAARTVSQGGDIAQFTTLALLALHLTGSGLGVSAVVLAEIAAVLLLAPLAGPLVDRFPRVKVMIIADLVRLVLAVVLVGWHANIAEVYALAFGLSAGSVFFNPAAGALLPTLVEEDRLISANAGIWSAAVLSQIVLAPLAGLLVATVGYGWGFGVNAVSYASSAVLLTGLRTAEAQRPIVTTSIWTQGREALSLLAHHRLLRALVVAQALAALSAGATSALLVVLARDQFGVAGGGYGLMLAAIGIGAFTGPLVLARFSAKARRPLVVFGAFGLRGAVDVTLAEVSAFPAALGALVIYGIGTSTGSVTFSSVIQSHVPSKLRGRVFSAFDFIWQSMRLVSLLAGGVLADRFGIRAVYFAGGTLLIAAAAVGVTAATTRQQQPGT